jgi:hypothetical protein
MALPEGVCAARAMIAQSLAGFNKQRRQFGGLRSIAEAGADSYALAAGGAAAAEHRGPGIGLHAGAEAVGFHALAAIGLKRALGHKNILLIPDESLCLDGKTQVYRRLAQESSPNSLPAAAALRRAGVEPFSAVAPPPSKSVKMAASSSDSGNASGQVSPAMVQLTPG